MGPCVTLSDISAKLCINHRPLSKYHTACYGGSILAPDGKIDPTHLPLARGGSFSDGSLLAETSSYQCPSAQPRAWQTACL